MFIHIGAPKSGSTYLQRLLWRNQRILATDGVILPGKGQNAHFHAGWDVREAPQSAMHPQESWKGAFERLVADLETTTASRAVITDERLCAATADQVARVMRRLAAFDVHVVYCVRDFAGLLGSAWQQWVKHGSKQTFHTWLDRTREHRATDWFWQAHDVDSVLRRWSPGERRKIHVITLPGPESPQEELWSRLRSVIGWSCDTNTELPPANTSLGFLEATLLSHIQGRIPTDAPAARRRLITHRFVADNVLASMANAVPILVPEHHRDWVEEESERRITTLRESGVQIVGDMDDLRSSDRRFGEVSTAGHEGEMLDAAIEVASRLVGRHAQVQLQVTRLERRVAAMESPASASWHRIAGTARARVGHLRRRVAELRSRPSAP